MIVSLTEISVSFLGCLRGASKAPPIIKEWHGGAGNCESSSATRCCTAADDDDVHWTHLNSAQCLHTRPDADLDWQASAAAFLSFRWLVPLGTISKVHRRTSRTMEKLTRSWAIAEEFIFAYMGFVFFFSPWEMKEAFGIFWLAPSGGPLDRVRISNAVFMRFCEKIWVREKIN